MTQKDILERNKLIAEFMGAKPTKKHPEIQCMLTIKNNKSPSIQYWHLLKYNYRWDWLMPVIEKIEDLGFPMEIHQEYLGSKYVAFKARNGYIGSYHEVKDLIEKFYLAVIEFINWFNENK